MLCHLTIRNIVLIDQAELSFAPELNVLTGETGAGKSIMLDALGFVLGWRVRSGLVRAGTELGEVTAEFRITPSHPAYALLSEAGIGVEDDILLLRRTCTADGRRQAWANDRRIAAETLKSIGATLVELHGQQDDGGLLDARGHLAHLDTFAGTTALRDEVQTLWRERTDIAREIAAFDALREKAEAERGFLEHAVAEFNDLAVVDGEEPELDARRRQLRSAEKIREDVAQAMAALGPEGAEGAVFQAVRWLEGASAHAEAVLDPALDGLARVASELAEVSLTVQGVLDDLSGDPGELERVEERLFAIRGLARKHQVTPDALPALAEDLRARLTALETGSERGAGLAKRLSAADLAYDAMAENLRDARKAAATRLDARMSEELAPLKMDRAQFVTRMSEAERGPNGIDLIQFTAATNRGTAPGPIQKIASGGELSRFLLALKVCLNAETDAKTLIFDEIDRGVGGATADAVGRRLRRLGQEGQVLVVTHSPQVAACAEQHWRVGKSEDGGQTRTTISPLDAAARREEIARMLAGDVITDEARAAAEALISA